MNWLFYIGGICAGLQLALCYAQIRRHLADKRTRAAREAAKRKELDDLAEVNDVARELGPRGYSGFVIEHRAEGIVRVHGLHPLNDGMESAIGTTPMEAARRLRR